MDDAETERLLKAFPGSKRAAQGVILKLDDEHTFHVLSVRPQAESAGLDVRESFFIPFCAKSEILRLRSLRGPHDYLLRIRAEAIVNSPRTVRVMMKRRELFEATGRPWALTHYYHSLDSFHKIYINNLQKAASKALKSIPSGLVPITEANAACIGSLTGEVVVVSESLYHFYYFMTIAVYGGKLELAFADRINALLIAFRIMNEAESLDFDLDQRGILPLKIERRLQVLVHDQMQFTFGHEYAHLLCGHASTGTIAMSGDSADARTFSHGLEFEADAHAIRLVQHNALTEGRIAHAGLSVLVFLTLLHRLKGIYSLRPLPVSETHPDPIDRLWAIRGFLGQRSPLDDNEIKGILADCTQLLDAFPHLLASANREDILTFYGSIYLPSYIGNPKLDRIDF